MGVWTKLYCKKCGKIVSHRTKGEFSPIKALTDENTNWECWSCKTKGKPTTKTGKIPESLKDQMIDELREQAWKELIKEGLVRKEKNDHIWTHKGNVEIQKFWLKFGMALKQKEHIRFKK